MGFAIGIRYLTGYSIASTRPDGEPEWPPHPARVFMALAAAHFETEADSAERAALSWLESLNEQPALFASEMDRRSSVTCFVPVNDKPIGKNPGLLQSVPGWMRSKQARTYPRVRLHDDRVFLAWKSDCAPEHRSALEALCRKVTRIGHSSSLVQMWLADANDGPSPNWIPDDVEGRIRLRKMTPGLMQYLEEQYGEPPRTRHEEMSRQIQQLKSEKKALGRGGKARKDQLQQQIDELEKQLPDREPRGPLRPTVGVWQGYRRPVSELNGDLPGTIWDPRLIVFRFQLIKSTFRWLELASTLHVTGRMHEAVIKSAHAMFCGCDKWNSDAPLPSREERPDCWQRIPGAISGHQADGSPTDKPHIAYFPLAFVGHEHADGHLLGLAAALPGGLDRNARRNAASAVMGVTRLNLGRLGVWELQPDDRETPPQALRPETWTALNSGATQWATVTPIVFDQHPKTKDRVEYRRQIAEMIRNGCRRIAHVEGAGGRELPQPREIILTPVSAHLGVPASHDFPRMKRKDGSERRHVHAILTFDEPVRGPIAVGAGRYRGYGFFRPLYDERIW